MKYLLFLLMICFAVNANGQSLKGIPSDPRLELYTAIFQRAAYSGKGDNCDSVNYWRNRALKAEQKTFNTNVACIDLLADYKKQLREARDSLTMELQQIYRRVDYGAWGAAIRADKIRQGKPLYFPSDTIYVTESSEQCKCPFIVFYNDEYGNFYTYQSFVKKWFIGKETEDEVKRPVKIKQ